jgi:molybdopterin molybdotransferase
MALLPVADALARILAGASRLGEETMPLRRAAGRVLAAPLAAKRTQPPFDCSSMDGYAVRAADVREGEPLLLVGESAAGTGFAGTLGPGETVRIFTGAPLPDGADAVIAQEDSSRAGDAVSFSLVPKPGKFIRKAGLDFSTGEKLLAEGRLLGPKDVSLAAAMGHVDVAVARRPRIALLATGDELAEPGSEPGPRQIPASNSYALLAIAEMEGAEPIDLGIARDTPEALAAALARAKSANPDVLVTLGGASVGDYDLVRDALVAGGLKLDFAGIAMRPGKPLMHGTIGPARFIGLPGNPVSAIVCATLFLVPLIRALQGRLDKVEAPEPALLGAAMPANDHREDYVRGRLETGADGGRVAIPFPVQDSSMLRTLATSDCLIIRAPNAPAAAAGEKVEILRL